MDDQTKEARRYLADIPDMERYLNLMSKVKLTDTEREVCDMKYLRGLGLISISEELGYSEAHIKRIHQRILRKLTRIF